MEQNQQPVPVAPAQPVAPVVQPTPVTELPDNTRDRTRDQFDKLLESNRKLFEQNESLRQEIERRQSANQIFNPIQTVPQPTGKQQDSSVSMADFLEVDQNGEQFINEAKLSKKLQELQAQASRANQAIDSYIKTSEEREIERQNREAYNAHPELNPTGQGFDAALSRQVRGILFDSMYNAEEYGGRPLSFKEAADFVKSNFQKIPVQPDASKQAEAEKANDSKEQGSAQVVSQPQNAPTPVYNEELNALRMRTRVGDTEALARRLLNTDHVLAREG